MIDALISLLARVGRLAAVLNGHWAAQAALAAVRFALCLRLAYEGAIVQSALVAIAAVFCAILGLRLLAGPAEQGRTINR